MIILLFNSFLQEEEMFRLLQASTAAAFLGLLVLCISIDGVKWWFPSFLYLLMLSCLVTFLTSFFMRVYTVKMCVITICCVAVVIIAAAVQSYVKPMAQNQRISMQRRAIFLTLPAFFFFLVTWIMGVGYEGGIGYFDRLEEKTDRQLVNQQTIAAKQDTLKSDLELVKASNRHRDTVSRENMNKLNGKFSEVKDEMQNLSLRLHRLETNDQQERRNNRR